MVLTGSNFVSGSTSVAVTGTGLIPISVKVDTATSAVVTLTLSGQPGKYPLKVTTPGGTSTNSQTFTVNSGSFALSSEFEVTSFLGPDGGAGSADGAADSARFASPVGIWADSTYAYVADSNNGTIRRVTLLNGQATTIAGTAGVFGNNDATGTFASFFAPTGLWGDGTNLYITDRDNLNVRKLEISSGRVTTVAGAPGTIGLVDGTGTNASFLGPTGIWGDGTNLYVADGYYSLTTRSIRYRVKRYALQAGITRKVTPHALRHAAISHSLANGANILKVKELAGHASLTTTQRYLQDLETMRGNAVDFSPLIKSTGS